MSARLHNSDRPATTRGNRQAPTPAPRVCHIAAGDQWAGAEVQLAIAMRGLAATGDFDLSAIILNEGRLAAELRHLGIPVHVPPDSRGGTFHLIRDLRSLLSSRRIAIVHTHKRKENIIAGLAARLAGVPHLVRTVHGLEDTHLRFPDPTAPPSLLPANARTVKNSLANALDGLITRLTTHALIAVSHDIARRLAGSHLRCDNIAIIHNGIDPDTVRPLTPAPEIKRKLGLASNTLVVGTAGRLVPVKGLEVFIQAAHGIAQRLDNARFLVVGDGLLRDHLVNVTRSCGMEGKIVFCGFRHDIHEVLNATDVFVMTSFFEGIPIVVLEAMALGKPVVLSNTGGHAEILSDGGQRFLTAPGDPAALMTTCLDLLCSPTERARAGRLNRQIVNQRFSAARMVEQIRAVYRGVLAN